LSGALHLAVFEQPGLQVFFDNLLELAIDVWRLRCSVFRETSMA
jgi:hypothetical protein